MWTKCLKQAATTGGRSPRADLHRRLLGSLAGTAADTWLREAIAKGAVACVMVFSLDRPSRNVRDTVNLVLEEWSKTYKVVFRSVTEDFDTDSPWAC